MLGKCIRGGICYAIHQHVKGNKNQMKDDDTYK